MQTKRWWVPNYSGERLSEDLAGADPVGEDLGGEDLGGELPTTRPMDEISLDFGVIVLGIFLTSWVGLI